MIRALIHYLSTKEWKFTNETIMNIINEKYSASLENEVQDLVIETLSNKFERELLYRLSIIDWPFTFEDVKIICDIDPVIEKPMECFNKLTNIWVKDDNATYTVSPLIKKIAEKNVALNTKKSIYLAMLNVIMKRKVLSPAEVLKVITYFLGAEEYDNVGLVLINTLNEMDMQNINRDEWGFSSIWYGIQLPEKMQIDIKLYLRVIQVKYCILIGKDIDTLLEDFDNLLKQSNISFIALYMAVILSLKKPQKANEYFLKSINSSLNMQLPNGESIELPKGFHIESLIWITGSSIKSNEDIFNWINTLKQLSQKQIEIVFADDIAEQACFNVVNCIWLQECKKEKPDWDTILSYLIELSDFAQERKQELLWACSIRGRIIVLAEYKGNIDAAIKLAEESQLRLLQIILLYISL